MSRFSDVKVGCTVEIYALCKMYAEDTFQSKVNLGVGAYRNDQGQPWVLPVVRKTELALSNDDSLTKEYLPCLGLEAFSYAATKLLLGEDSPAIIENRSFGVQSLSGTGALRIGAEFLVKQLRYTIFYCSQPTWENHILIFTNAGFTDFREYRYWSAEKRGIDMPGLLEDLQKAPENSVIVLHVCAHNPTGCDPTHEQWEQIANVMKEKKLFPFFDSAYQGFATGDVSKDAYPVRYFVSKGMEFFCAQSFAKNFGLYNERVGNLTVVQNATSEMVAVKSQMTLIIRGMYSSPPGHGARIIAYILNNPQLFEQWKDHIRTMSSRISLMRQELRAAIERLGTSGHWSHLTSQIGMFSYTGLTENQAEYMVKEHHCYMLKSSRINMCGITHENVNYVAKAIYDAVMSAD